MEKLEALSSITRLSDRVVRVLGQNPGKFTLQGTNTYLIGLRNPYKLVDTGEGHADYIPLLESALRDSANTHEPHISDIIISHWHHDHVGGISSVLQLLRRLWDDKNDGSSYRPPRLHKFPLAASPAATYDSIIGSVPRNLYTPNPSGSMFHDLHDMQTFALDDSSILRVLHTPGHTKDSISLHIPGDNALYTADTVLGQGTAVFEDLASYIASLRKMLDYQSTDASSDYTALYPGHGPVVTDGPKLISTYIEHRMERENQLVHILKQPSPQGQPWTNWDIVSTIYAAYPPNLWLPASNSIDQHLKKLELEGRVRRLGGEGKDGSWELLSKL
ncbi:hypothetical protein SERLA73DRAFT_94409 [Serpula lacrymans var. lacrymans S7.3]|uniref:Metallo-beta-lactamase domain-containing protein n=1 Tax=Serpula lacrymans var. lacrymans (strain S7.3) TaxID=936435 RepID=F8Q6Q0_SERL3|nr:hypothetical protein SERLA73DRAFT_94409 [Serpula lacrymans var. lacrymans S7.3]